VAPAPWSPLAHAVRTRRKVSECGEMDREEAVVTGEATASLSLSVATAGTTRPERSDSAPDTSRSAGRAGNSARVVHVRARDSDARRRTPAMVTSQASARSVALAQLSHVPVGEQLDPPRPPTCGASSRYSAPGFPSPTTRSSRRVCRGAPRRNTINSSPHAGSRRFDTRTTLAAFALGALALFALDSSPSSSHGEGDLHDELPSLVCA